MAALAASALRQLLQPPASQPSEPGTQLRATVRAWLVPLLQVRGRGGCCRPSCLSVLHARLGSAACCRAPDA